MHLLLFVGVVLIFLFLIVSLNALYAVFISLIAFTVVLRQFVLDAIQAFILQVTKPALVVILLSLALFNSITSVIHVYILVLHQFVVLVDQVTIDSITIVHHVQLPFPTVDSAPPPLFAYYVMTIST